MGMAVDANVLIFSRIREEALERPPQAAIMAGFDRAFTTIVDSNITHLLVALVLLAFGSGPIKGFAVVLTLGILTSMFTAITVTRAMVNLFFGGRNLKKLSV
jgi:preprotein translocase subunit SecD